jgi:hypothetical protein
MAMGLTAGSLGASALGTAISAGGTIAGGKAANMADQYTAEHSRLFNIVKE